MLSACSFEQKDNDKDENSSSDISDTYESDAYTDYNSDTLADTAETSDNTESDTEAEITLIDKFISSYNMVADTKITNAVEFDVSDKNSGHYRTEFRLGTFSNAIAKSGKIGEFTVDIVSCGWANDELRLYADDIDVENAIKLIRYASPIMDETASDAEIQSVIDHLSEYGDTNGKYYGKLCVIYSSLNGELMIKTE